MIKLVILDRDGVINHESVYYIKSPEEWIPIPGSLEAIVQLNKAGISVAIATNQSGVGRGYYDLAMLETIHQKMQQSLAKLGGHIDLIEYCPHRPEGDCECRKPKPGLITKILAYFKLDPKITRVPTIGDSLRDLKAAKAVNCEPILVLTGNGKSDQFLLPNELKATPIYANLAEAVHSLLKEDNYVIS